MKVNKYKLSLEILEYFSKQDKPVLRANIIGLDYQEGNFGRHHNKILSNEERSMLDLVINELQQRGFIQPVYKDILSRGQDLMITDRGSKALEKRALDDLDELLLALNSNSDLISMRYGAYEAMLMKRTDWERQAATSLIELIDHVLRTIAPTEKVRKQDWFSSDNKVTRKIRIKYFLESKSKERSKSTEKIVNKAWELIDANRSKLEKVKHTSDSDEGVERLIRLVEDSLIYLLS